MGNFYKQYKSPDQSGLSSRSHGISSDNISMAVKLIYDFLHFRDLTAFFIDPRGRQADPCNVEITLNSLRFRVLYPGCLLFLYWKVLILVDFFAKLSII